MAEAIAETVDGAVGLDGTAEADGAVEMVREFVDSAGQRIGADRSGGVLRGVKLLGLESKNGRVYRESALRDAAPLYEGAKVNVNHPAGDPLSPRDYRDRLGVVRGVELRGGEGLFGDLHYNPKHPLAEQLVWDAEHAPQNVGLSHNVAARTGREGDRVTVESIARVHSVDLVADPATTSGLFEQSEAAPEAAAPAAGGLAAEVAELRAQVRVLERCEAIREALSEHGLDVAGGPGVDADFLAALREAADEPAVRRLVAERAALVERLREAVGQRPACTSREAAPYGAGRAGAIDSVADFVAAVTRR